VGIGLILVFDELIYDPLVVARQFVAECPVVLLFFEEGVAEQRQV
jgi:hypothetical protein